LKNRGFILRTVGDKARLEQILKSLKSDARSASEALDYATKQNLIYQSESHKIFVKQRDLTLNDLKYDNAFKAFEPLYQAGNNTRPRINKKLNEFCCPVLGSEISEDKYKDLEKKLKKKAFYNALFSPNISFDEILSYYKYQDTSENLSTMHKTKGTGIDNVLVVLDEYDWTNEYNFLSCFSGQPPAEGRETNSRKLLYVAFSRAKFNLICVRVVETREEADRIAAFFPKSEEIELKVAS
jgi:DNA helicase II / ATP-dependent DNA helicase PcrA